MIVSAVANANLVYPTNFAPPKAATDESSKGVEKLLAAVNNVSARVLSANRRDNEEEGRSESPECGLEGQ